MYASANPVNLVDPLGLDSEDLLARAFDWTPRRQRIPTLLLSFASRYRTAR
jgi:hypothetical protein